MLARSNSSLLPGFLRDAETAPEKCSDSIETATKRRRDIASGRFRHQTSPRPLRCDRCTMGQNQVILRHTIIKYSLEQESERSERAKRAVQSKRTNEQTAERVTQYLRLDSWLFWTTVLLTQPSLYTLSSPRAPIETSDYHRLYQVNPQRAVTQRANQRLSRLLGIQPILY